MIYVSGRRYVVAVFALVSVAVGSLGRAAADERQSAHIAPANTNESSSDSANVLEEVVVTAQKRNENLQKVPIAVNVVNSAALEQAGINTTLDLGNAVPGLRMLNIGGQVAGRIRGIGSTAIAPGQEAPVAIVIDGIYYASASDVGGSLPDATQIAVLKGPQGTLFGRNATGGVIQISTRDPSNHFESDYATSIDNYLTSRSDVYVGGPLTSSINAGLSAQYVWQGNGWGSNAYNDEWVHRINHDVSVRGKLNFALSDDTSIRVSADYADRAGSTAGVFTVAPGYPQAYASPISANPWGINSYLQPALTYRGGGLSVTFEQDLGSARFSAISAYRQSAQYWAFSPTATAVPSLDLALHDFSKQFTEEIQLVSQNNTAFTWAVGAFYIFNDAGQPPPGEAINIQAGPYRGEGPFSRVSVITDQHMSSPALFAQGTYRLAEHTRLTVGGRYTYEKKVLEGSEYATLAAAPVQVPLISPAETSLVVEKPTWRLALDQDLTDGVIGYVSYNRGFKSGGFNVRDITNPPYQPEKLDAYEMGIKSQFLNDRVRLNGAAFYYDYKNIQVARYETNSIIFNGAGARLYGVDLDGEARLTRSLRMHAGLEWLHNRFTDFPNAVSSSYVPAPGGAIITLFPQSASGKTLPYSPTLTYTVGADYDIDSPVGPLTLNVTDSYSSKYYAEPDNLLTQSSYHFVDTSLTWKLSEHLELRLFANNLLNEAVASQFATLPTGYLADYPNPPRTYGIKFHASY
jgi:iron complex outermembrane receptor protein